MPDRRSRLPAGTRAASQRAVQKVFENELALAELKATQEIRRRLEAIPDERRHTIEVDGRSVEVVELAAVEDALAGR